MITSTTLVYLFIAWMAIETYQGWTKRKKILCRFRRRNKTIGLVWAEMHDQKVFDGDYEFTILTERIYSQWFRSGMYFFFPILIPTLDFYYGSRWPLNPETGKYDVISPQALKSMNNEARFISFGRGIDKQAGVKTKMGMMQYLPYVAIILVAVYFYFQNQGINTQLASLTNAITSIGK